VTALPEAEAVATCVLPARAQLGECPIWSPAEGRLYWVDIDGRAVHRFDTETGADEVRAMAGRPTAIALTQETGRLLVAVELELGFLDWPTGTWTDWITLEPDNGGNRLNDGRCDPAGRFWVGSMFEPTAADRSTGILHRVGGDGTVADIRSGIGISNGLAFSPDGRTMYFADTSRRTVWAYDFDPDDGHPSNERVFVDFSTLPGKPDGACVDADGGYWIACVYGWAVARVMPDGRVDRLIEVPVEKPSMPAFGGSDMSTVFVTSIRRGVDGHPKQPEAGSLFAFDAGVRGLPAPVFAGGRT
jgi:sugar lactone lactonase YvrE